MNIADYKESNGYYSKYKVKIYEDGFLLKEYEGIYHFSAPDEGKPLCFISIDSKAFPSFVVYAKGTVIIEVLD